MASYRIPDDADHFMNFLNLLYTRLLLLVFWNINLTMY